MGTVASQNFVVLTFEKIGMACCQPGLSEPGLRLFGGHTPRVTGAQMYAALGLGINKSRLLARHSGDTILRYVQDAPLRSIRTDLGLAALNRPTALNIGGPSGSSDSSKRSSLWRAR